MTEQEQKLSLEFSSPMCAAKFRRALKNVRSKARIETDAEGNTIMFLRPLNLLEFGASLNRRGMDKCKTSNAILRFLDANKEESIRFEHLN